MAHRLRVVGLSAASCIALAAACGTGSSAPLVAADGGGDAASLDAAAAASSSDASLDAGPAPKDATADVDKSATCAATFGMSLTPKFGRFDGTVVAVVPPADNACAMPNSTHLVIQGSWNGAVYRMVVDVLSTIGSPDVAFYEMDAPLVGGAWAEGWHDTIPLDYVTNLAVHKTSFVPMKQLDLVAKITSEIDIGTHISVFATSGTTEPHSAHLIHRNVTNQDGAIVLAPDSPSAHWLLLAFPQQTF